LGSRGIGILYKIDFQCFKNQGILFDCKSVVLLGSVHSGELFLHCITQKSNITDMVVSENRTGQSFETNPFGFGHALFVFPGIYRPGRAKLYSDEAYSPWNSYFSRLNKPGQKASDCCTCYAMAETGAKNMHS
jgi:hypothetical protein